MSEQRRRPRPQHRQRARFRRRRITLLAGVTLLLAAGAVVRQVTASNGSPPSAHGAPADETRSTVTVVPPPGTSGWFITNAGNQHDIEGFADRVSVNPGDPLHLYVSTTSPTYAVSVYRMGWYAGSEATLVSHDDGLVGHVQAPSTVTSPTNTVVAPWSDPVAVATRAWSPGTYLIRLDSSQGAQRFIPVTVRGASAVGKIVLVDAVTTWQAYNAWGGYSLYHGPGGEPDFAHRARAVSFDRPYLGDGAADFIGNELPLIALAERLGLPLDYVTDVDLHADPHLLDGARAVISLGHDEYWSSAMRATVTAARDRGTNVAFLGANAVFRHIRLGRTPIGPDRLETNYKRPNEDPLVHTDPAEVTSDWREPPVPLPESTLTGALYECNPVSADMVITDPGSWLFAGLGATAGMHVPGLVGAEYDRVNPAAPTPHPIEVLAHSPVTCRRAPSYADAAYYTTPGGAGVFDSGTSAWVANLTICTNETCRLRNQVVTTVTTNLLRAFAVGPAGTDHPATDNLAALDEYRGDPIAHPAPSGSRSTTSDTRSTKTTSGTTTSTTTSTTTAPVRR